MRLSLAAKDGSAVSVLDIKGTNALDMGLNTGLTGDPVSTFPTFTADSILTITVNGASHTMDLFDSAASPAAPIITSMEEMADLINTRFQGQDIRAEVIADGTDKRLVLWSPKGYLFEVSGAAAADIGFPPGNDQSGQNIGFMPSVTGTTDLRGLTTFTAGDALTIAVNDAMSTTETITIGGWTPQQAVDLINSNTNLQNAGILASINSKGQLVIQSKSETTFTVTGAGNAAADIGIPAAGIDSSAPPAAGQLGPFNQTVTQRTGNNVKNVDFFGVIDQLISTVEGGNVDGISDIMLTKLDHWMNTLLKTRAQVGALTNRYNTTESRYIANNTAYEELHSQTVGVDLAETITQYEMASSIYEASLASIARIMQATLLDFLR
jgi:flagellar hook-associated protein 3 FlgL